MKRAWRGTDAIRAQAQRLRAAPSDGEARLWARIRAGALGVKFRQQHPIAGFIADFYAPWVGLVVEVDGAHHDTTRERDAERDRLLTERGLRVVRFHIEDVTLDIDSVVVAIRVEIERLKCCPTPPQKLGWRA